MRAQRQISPTGGGPGRRPGGFARLEVALGLLVIALAAALVLTLAGRLRQRRNCDGCLRELGALAAVFSDYHRQHHAWPPSSGPDAALPPDLAAALKDTAWFTGSPFGGNYGWVAPDPTGAAGNGPVPRWGGRGAVTLTAFAPSFPLSLDQTDLLYIDSQIDDGNLATGRFRAGFNGWPVYLVEAAAR